MSGIFFAGCVSAAVSVAAGAFGAHALKGRLEPEMLVVFETACRYQMYHSLALMGISIAGKLWGTERSLAFRMSGFFFIGGIVLFSGSLFLYALLGQQWAVVVTPVGGLFFLAGWISPLFGGKQQ